ncbi:MAG: hypothetical protein MUC51_12060 [Anaerolineae bacterium]|jgi:hypothetical protein|nr:hypothetical protein [Anaerolineae bacterium]
MEPLMAYSGNDLMNMVVSKTYTSQRNKFKGSGSSNGIAFTFDVTETPVAKLVAGVATHNFELDLKVAITAKGGSIDFNKAVTMRATGKLAVVRSVLSLTDISARTTSTNIVDQLVIGIIDSQIIPRIRTELRGIPIPQLTNLFGSGLSASLHSGTVISGSALQAGARLTGKSGIGAADAPTAANIAALNVGSSASALVMGMVSSSAVNALIKAMVPPVSYSFDQRASAVGFAAGIKGTIKATTPVLTVTNGTGEAATTVSISNLRAGIDTPLTNWDWLSLSGPSARVVVKHTLSTSGSAGVITLTGVGVIKLSLNWPNALKPVEGLLVGLLNSVLSLFRSMISNAVKGKKFELFKLPTTVPGTNWDANLDFDSNGLGYYKSSVRALVRIQNV